MKPMNWMKVFAGALSIGLLSSTAAIQAMGQELPKVYDASVPRERQIALAESAAPAEVSSKATVYILGLKGDEKVREGTNGFSCYRWPAFCNAHRNDGRAGLLRRRRQPAPFCIVYLREEELRSSGKSEAEIKADVANGYKEGRLKYPSKPGFLYMMSSENRLLPPCHWQLSPALDVLCAEHDNERYGIRLPATAGISGDDASRSSRIISSS